MDVTLPKQVTWQLSLQRTVAVWNSIWFVPLTFFVIRVCLGYRCKNITEVRSKFSSVLQELKGRQIILCSNHLTMIDSIILVCFLQPLLAYIFRSQPLPWSVPEASNFRVNPIYRIICYLGKCVYIERQGSAMSRRVVWAQLKGLLRGGDIVSIFPEGGRSRSGEVVVSECVYGVGEIMYEMPECAVICVYMRGESQKTYGYLPRFGDIFRIDIQAMTPTTLKVGRRAHKDLTLQVMHRLKSMESDYFSGRE